jgi:bacillithiol biosynthesis deacetylase BshB1
MTSDVLCVGAHPDDVEIGMGATAAAMARGGLRVALVDLTNGEPTPHGSPEIRAEESAKAARILGVERRCLGMSNRFLMDTVENRTALAEVIRELRPRIVFAPYPTDAHPDHVAAASIALGARFYAKFTKTDMAGEPHYPSKLLHYVAVHLALHVKPAFIMAADPIDLERKLEALRAYESQFTLNEGNAGVIPLMQQRAAYWGGLIGAAAGEPFFSHEEIGVRSVLDLL